MRKGLRQKRGAALVVTLCILVLLTVLVLTYFDRALLNRKIGFSSAGQARAQAVALTAMEVITGDLRGEMYSGSTKTTDNGYTILTPNTNFTMVPSRTGTVAGMSNLIKWSSGGATLWPAGAPYNEAGPVRAAVGNSTVTPSANGRFIATTRWGLPQFGTNFNAANTPSWVLLTRSGPLPNAATAAANLKILSDSTAANGNFVIGRFAYAIYDVGGLLDVTAVGYPNNLSPNFSARKGTLGYADLTQIGLSSTEINTLVNWRNAASVTNYPAYLKNFAAEHGFLRAAEGDQAFLSRQDLLDFWKAKMNSPELVRYFTTFSRETNAPSFSPPKNASEWGGSNDGFNSATLATTNGIYAYRSRANDEAAINRSFTQVRVRNAFNRRDGTKATPGEPLIKSRFDLNKLSWIRHDGTLPHNVTKDDIFAAFGLTRNSDGSWVYGHPGAMDRILTLDEVARENREPDFFELLQAGLLQGSLGLASGDIQQRTSADNGGEYYRLTGMGWQSPLVRSDTNGKLVYGQEKYQVIQIGANLIDQADTDGYPTEIVLNGESFYGIENLPYINAISDIALRPPPGGAITPNDYQAYVHRWIGASLWNPHQNASTPPQVSPARIRLYISGGEGIPKVHNLPGSLPASYSARVFRPGTIGGSVYGANTLGPAWIGLSLSDYVGRFSEPTAIDYDKSFTSVPSGDPNLNDPKGRIQTTLGWKRAGIYMGWSFSPDNPAKVSLCAPLWAPVGSPPGTPNQAPVIGYNAANYTWITPLVIQLQYEESADNWKTYQVLRGVIPSRDGRGDAYMEPRDPEWAKWAAAGVSINSKGPLADDQDAWVLAFLDPRSPRLNMPSRLGLKSAETYLVNQIDTSPPVGPRFPKSPKLWSNWVNNSATSDPSYYTDRDAVRRMGDAAGWSGATPLAANAPTRPLMLDRPFQSVGEIGYVFRDDPWKSLNLISANSADAALLDLFYVGPQEPEESNVDPDVVAGKVNINSASKEVIQALIAGAARNFANNNPDTVNATISTSADITELAKQIVSYIEKNGPLLNVSDLPNVFPQDTTYNTRNPANKKEREALLRGLSGVVATRTWNLMVDVVAQAGRFKPNAANLNEFIVEGEKRYWLHLAIDRFTGKVTSQTLEPVAEW